MKLWDEFKAFAFKGNMIDLAVAVVIGAAFTLVVNSLVKDILMQVIAAIVGKPDFSQLTFKLGDGVIFYGNFLTVLINFLIVAFALFIVVKGMNATRREQVKAPAAPPEPWANREAASARETMKAIFMPDIVPA